MLSKLSSALQQTLQRKKNRHLSHSASVPLSDFTNSPLLRLLSSPHTWPHSVNQHTWSPFPAISPSRPTLTPLPDCLLIDFPALVSLVSFATAGWYWVFLSVLTVYCHHHGKCLPALDEPLARHCACCAAFGLLQQRSHQRKNFWR